MSISFEDRRAELQDAIRSAEPHRRRFDYLQSIYRNGTANDALRSYMDIDRRMVTVNIAFANVRSLVALTLPAKHRITAKSERDEDQPILPIAEKLDDYAWRKLKIKQEETRVQYDAFIFGCGFMKLGFGSEFGMDDKTLSGLQTFDKALMRAVGLVNEKRQKNDPYRKGRGDLAVEFNPNVRAAMPWAMRLSPYSVFPDPMVDRFENGRFLIIKVVRTLDDVRRDPKYKNTEDLTPDGYLNPMYSDPISRQQSWRDNPSGFQVMESTSFDQTIGESKRTPIVTLYEFWDKRDGKYYVLSQQNGITTYLREPQDWPFPQLGTFPVFPLQFNVSPDEPWAIGDVEVIWRNQQELNHLRTIMLEHVRRCTQHRILAPASASDDDLTNLANPDYVKIVRSADPTMWGAIDFGDLKPEAYNVANLIEQDILNVSGLSANQRGAAEDTTATESSIIETNVQLLTEQRRRTVSEHVGDVLGGVWKIWRNLISPEMLIDICGEDAIGKIVATDLEHTTGSFDFEIEYESAAAQTLAVQRGQMIETLNLAAMLKEKMLIPEVNLQLMLKQVTELSGFKEIDKILPDQPEMPNATDLALLQQMQGGMMGQGQPMNGQQEEQGETEQNPNFQQAGGAMPENQMGGEPSSPNELFSAVGGQPNLKRGAF